MVRRALLFLLLLAVNKEDEGLFEAVFRLDGMSKDLADLRYDLDLKWSGKIKINFKIYKLRNIFIYLKRNYDVVRIPRFLI